jgi:hypothetical protein
VQAPHFEVVDGQSAYPPTSHGKCADGETSDDDGTNRRAPKGQRAQCGRANGEGARPARSNLSRLFLLKLFVFIAHDGPSLVASDLSKLLKAPIVAYVHEQASSHLSSIDAKHISFA